MSRIFPSHSASDNAEAVASRDWLTGEGFDDLFLDLGPVRGIVAGERWERALNEASNCCQAVVFHISRSGLASAKRGKRFRQGGSLTSSEDTYHLSLLGLCGVPPPS